MTPEQYRRFKSGTLLAKEMALSSDKLYITETRRDPETALVLRATFSCETLLTLTRRHET